MLNEPQLESNIQIQSFDSGSYWIEIAMGSVTALSFVAGLIWSGTVIYKKIIEIEAAKETLKILPIYTDSIKDLEGGIAKLINTLCESEAKQLCDQNKLVECSPEYEKRLMFSIKTMAELIHKGAEFHHALNAPEDVKNLFPNYGNLLQVNSKIKQLNDKTGKE
ncbi:hypothetical protein ACJDU8_15655 [Clostridium sp. WILCCON 0269]|uniref:LemA family protein n=1 Tax=Candidatus Clostridium eludens TaxID=3381663 RepID=A0ABW8SMV3_9CLOT